jgi:hypothetical protein
MLLVECHHSVVDASYSTIISSFLVSIHVRMVGFRTDLLLELASHFLELLFVEELNVFNLL